MTISLLNYEDSEIAQFSTVYPTITVVPGTVHLYQDRVNPHLQVKWMNFWIMHVGHWVNLKISKLTLICNTF